jgi:hypothetical protein
MSETMGELVGRIARAKYEAELRANGGDRVAAESWRQTASRLEEKRLAWERGEPWTGGGD